MLKVPTQLSKQHLVRDEFLLEVIEGLTRSRKMLPCKYFYDERGMTYFDHITTTSEYYITRSEIEILIRHADSIASHLGDRVAIVELGGADSRKARILLEACASPFAYVPVDVSIASLCDAARQLSRQMPSLTVVPLIADFAELSRLPREIAAARNKVLYCAGSTLGNYDPTQASALLAKWASLMDRGQLLIGIDRKKERALLEAAYNDGAGYTAAFNLNLLTRLNREVGANFVVSAFEHVAIYDEEHGCMSMFLRSIRDQTVRVGGRSFTIKPGELIKTEDSFKYSVGEFQHVARTAGLEPVCHWTDSNDWFSLHLLAKKSKFDQSYDTRH